MQFADVSIPIEIGDRIARERDHSVADESGYRVKAVLNEAFGADAVRPWRMISDEDGVYRILGTVRSGVDVSPTKASRRLGIVTEIHDFPILEGVGFELDVQTAAVKAIKTRDAAGRVVSRTYVDVTAEWDPGRGMHVPARGAARDAGYVRWLVEQMDETATGLRLVEVPTILRGEPALFVRKFADHVRPLSIPTITARLRVLPVDVAKAEAFVAFGMKRMKDVGLGSILPSEVVDEVAA